LPETECYRLIVEDIVSTPQLDAFAPATVMLQALQTRQISAVELLEMHLHRIVRYNPDLNAIVSNDNASARHHAEAADAARARGENRPLLGLPITVKESINVRGLRTTVGMPDWSETYVAFDAPLVHQVRTAGAVIMGKTNVSPMIWDWQSNNPIFGRTNNPWDIHRTPGGSTGGGAAALAAGLTPLEFGSDIAGSIRVPAAFCGVYGHKPSETALPRSGQFPFPPLPNSGMVMGVLGPLARSGRDLALAFGITAGPEEGEDAAWKLEIPPARHARLTDYRVAVLPQLPWLPVDPEILACLDRLIADLERVGATVREAQPEGFLDLRQHTQVYLSLLWASAPLLAPPTTIQQLVERYRSRGDEFSAATVHGLTATAAEYFRLRIQREQYRAAYRAFFRDWDILLTPISLAPAFLHQAMPWPPMVTLVERTLDVDSQLVPYDWGYVYPGLATLSGQPATVFPCGLTQAGLPIGLQAIGPYLEDYTSIEFAALIEREFGGFRQPPGYVNSDR
jgi:amidase